MLALYVGEIVTSLLEVKNIKKHFPVNKGIVLQRTIGWVKAVDGVSFFINKGETFGLVGESGCGKTTLAKVILLLEKPTSGSLLYGTQNPFQMSRRELSEYRSSVQTVFQDPFSSLQPRKRVSFIVSEPLVGRDALSKGEMKDRVEKALEQVGLGKAAFNRFPHEFSGGQRQRIAIARALVSNPSLVLLDEPVSALDVSIRAQIMNLLKDLQQQLGTSYLLIAHNLATVRYMSHQVGVMYLGKLVERGRSEELYCNPFHPYTKALLSAALPFHPDQVKEDIILQGEVPSPLNSPAGCRFHPRCFSAIPVCREIEPSLKEVSIEHHVTCHLY